MSLPFSATAPMTETAERAAIELAQTGAAGPMEDLLRAQVRYIVGEARKMASATVAEDDLVQVGLAALVEAVRVFDLTRGVRLYTFARPRIREAMNEERARVTTAMTIPGRTLRRFEEARRATSTLDAAANYAEDHGMTRETFLSVADALNGGVALDAPAPRGHAPEPSLMGAVDTTPQPETTAVNRATVASILRAADLDERAHRVVALAFGFETGEELNDSEVAAVLGISRPTVGRIRNAALTALRAAA